MPPLLARLADGRPPTRVAQLAALARASCQAAAGPSLLTSDGLSARIAGFVREHLRLVVRMPLLEEAPKPAGRRPMGTLAEGALISPAVVLVRVMVMAAPA